MGKKSEVSEQHFTEGKALNFMIKNFEK